MATSSWLRRASSSASPAAGSPSRSQDVLSAPVWPTSRWDCSPSSTPAKQVLVSLVDQLVNIGAVRRERSRNDRRVQTIEITNEGRRLLKTATVVVEKLDDDLRKHLSPNDQQALDRLLPSLLQPL